MPRLPLFILSMKDIKILSFTKNGYILSKKIYSFLNKSTNIELSTYKKFIDIDDELTKEVESLSSWTAKNFTKDTALIFIGATGIAIRAIAPFVKDKFSDPAVICIDEKGCFVIPLLSGHIGGANELAKKISIHLKALAIITTATDINNKWAVDVWAKKNNLIIDSKQIAKEISAKVLQNKKIYIKSDFPINRISIDDIIESDTQKDIYISYKNKVETSVLKLVPACLCLGIGCKKDISVKNMFLAFNKFIEENNIDIRAIKYISSIDIKKEEKAILSLANYLGIEAKFFSAEELKTLEGEFTSSEFVSSIVKVDNVCERAAFKIYPQKLVSKTKLEGITMALCIDKSLSFEI